VNGDAMFHPECWTSLRQSSSPSGGPLALTNTEQELVKEASKTSEHHDPERDFKTEAARIASMLKNAEHCIAFTGAGISTAAGIGDFRGKDGYWTEEAKEKEFGKELYMSSN
jgi:mono-ADP-ribosyltransferase sirtuin 6